MYKYYAIYKPYEMLSQFSREGNKATLADLDFIFPKDVYPLGRLDFDSEGLLLLSNDKKLNKDLLDPHYAHEREYWVQVEGAISNEALERLKKGGIEIRVKEDLYYTRPCKATLLKEEPILPERNPPIRYRKNSVTSWISLRLTEGKNRQVRKMTAAVGFPTLRLVRYAILKYSIGGFQSGEVREINLKDMGLR